MDLGREFSPAEADCGYRAPLAPRLAQRYHASTADGTMMEQPKRKGRER